MDTKILVVVGPTASGKSELAVCLAKKFDGEIISCDSRQVYRDLNLGTGKVDGTWVNYVINGRPKRNLFIYKNIVHHCIDFVDPRRQYSVAQFQKVAQKTIKDILKRGRVPILCGGTGHWVDAVLYNQIIPSVKPDKNLRALLEKLSLEKLFKKLQALDPKRAETIDRHNSRRVIRALEIIMTTGQAVPILEERVSYYDSVWIGIHLPQEKLFKKIGVRLKKRLSVGMIKEVSKLHTGTKKIPNLSWKRLEMFGLEYKFIALYLQKKIPYEEMVGLLSLAIKHYAKRQMTWFKRNNDIVWFEKPNDALKYVAKII